ncbi:hypothetical protein F2Q70_00013105 [Brassica cretica]|nr:hypothetical protein F2Q68_00006185 [Brassica cretica]KAF2610735.1 hypothetical protein F2Q70_00013105 [Brassica cretica]
MSPQRNIPGTEFEEAKLVIVILHIAFNYLLLPLSNGDAPATSCLKLKIGGKGRPFGKRAFGSLSSSKNGCAHASS